MDDQDARAQQERIHARPTLEPGERDGALRVLAEALAADGREAVSEQGRLRLRAAVESARPGVLHLVRFDDDGELVGYGQLEIPPAPSGTPDPEPTAEAAAAAAAGAADETPAPALPSAEIVVAPAARGRGHGRRLLDAVLAAAAAAGHGQVDVWAHGGLPAARGLAEAYGAELVRELRQMRRHGPQTAEVALPAGVELRTFRPGEDDAAWLRLNASAFAHHPEQGAWTERDLADRLAEPWFDPAGFFLAVREGRPVGFHWTKVHPASALEPALGEVYVVGVDPAEQGGGLGRALTAVGLRHLTGEGSGERGLETVLLYVDADNPAAVRVYERLGFTVHEVDLMYRVRHRGADGEA